MPVTETIEKNILIVDNSKMIVDRLVGLLKEQHTKKLIFSATGFDEAVKILGEKRTAVVFIEINLPGKNGIELLEFIVKNHPYTKVVMLSNLVSDYYQRLCKKLGAIRFIDKSKEFDLVPEVIAEIEAMSV